ncbi:cellulose biosynthesis protein BcsS [Ancylobacter sp.]|uniref:cellulose biosynthesis protein BcsS n=1 Tax=Ancylobacter sp. TaxID=1872567 RepID=UPI003D12A064
MFSSPARALAPLVAALSATCLAPGAAAEEAAEASLRRRLYFYTGVDIARDNGYGWGGMAWAPFAPMDREGLRVRTQTGGGRYEYRTQAVAGGWNTVNKTDGEVLLGWQFLRGAHALALYGGVNVVDNALDQPDPGNRDQGTQWGAKFVAEWFYRLDERWTLTAALSASTADGTFNARATAAWQAFDWLNVGMETGATTDWLDESARVGLFVASPLQSWELRAAAGWRWSSDSDDSPYGTLSLFMPF